MRVWCVCVCVRACICGVCVWGGGEHRGKSKALWAVSFSSFQNFQQFFCCAQCYSKLLVHLCFVTFVHLSAACMYVRMLLSCMYV